jgi:hypothetical protein
MIKRTTVVYVYLVLFAFTLGFSFTLASQTQAEPDPFTDCTCCTTYCADNPEQIEVIGHNITTKVPGVGEYTQCIGGFEVGCGATCEHFTYQCGPEPN